MNYMFPRELLEESGPTNPYESEKKPPEQAEPLPEAQEAVESTKYELQEAKQQSVSSVVDEKTAKVAEKIEHMDEVTIPKSTQELLSGTTLEQKFGDKFETVCKQADGIVTTYVEAMVGHVFGPTMRARLVAGINASIIAEFDRVINKKVTPVAPVATPGEAGAEKGFSRGEAIKKIAWMDKFKSMADGLSSAFGPFLEIAWGYDVVRTIAKSSHNMMMVFQQAKSTWLINEHGLLVNGTNTLLRNKSVLWDPRKYAEFLTSNMDDNGLKLSGTLIKDPKEITDCGVYLTPLFVASAGSYDIHKASNDIGNMLTDDQISKVVTWVQWVSDMADKAKVLGQTLQQSGLDEIVSTFSDLIKQSPVLSALASFLFGPGRDGGKLIASDNFDAVAATQATGLEWAEAVDVTTLIDKDLFDLSPNEWLAVFQNLFGIWPATEFFKQLGGNVFANIIAIGWHESGWKITNTPNADGKQTALSMFQISTSGDVGAKFDDMVKIWADYIRKKWIEVEDVDLWAGQRELLAFIGHTVSIVPNEKYTTGEYEFMKDIFNDPDKRFHYLIENKLNESVEGPMFVAAIQRGVYDFEKVRKAYDGYAVQQILDVSQTNLV